MRPAFLLALACLVLCCLPAHSADLQSILDKGLAQKPITAPAIEEPTIAPPAPTAESIDTPAGYTEAYNAALADGRPLIVMIELPGQEIRCVEQLRHKGHAVKVDGKKNAKWVLDNHLWKPKTQIHIYKPPKPCPKRGGKWKHTAWDRPRGFQFSFSAGR